jgi:hypothetical protein
MLLFTFSGWALLKIREAKLSFSGNLQTDTFSMVIHIQQAWPNEKKLV